MDEEKKLYPIVVKQFQTNISVTSNQSNENLEKVADIIENSKKETTTNASSSNAQTKIETTTMAPLPVVVNSTKIKVIKKSKHVVDPQIEGSSNSSLASSLDDSNLNVTRFKAKHHTKTHRNTISIVQDDASNNDNNKNNSQT